VFVMSWDGINPAQIFNVGCALYHFMAGLGLNPAIKFYYTLYITDCDARKLKSNNH